MSFLKKYNWVNCVVCFAIWLIRYIRFEQTLWQLSGVLVFAILSILLFKQSKENTASNVIIEKYKHNYVAEAYQ